MTVNWTIEVGGNQNEHQSRCLIRILPNVLIGAAFLGCMLAGCAFEDSRTASAAQQRLIGWSELDLQSCLGAPDHESTIGDTNILTYYSNSTSNKGISLGVPLIGGVTLGGGGYCHAIFRVLEGHVAEVRYTGETDAIFAPNAYCAPILRGCVYQPEHVSGSPSVASDPAIGRPTGGP